MTVMGFGGMYQWAVLVGEMVMVCMMDMEEGDKEPEEMEMMVTDQGGVYGCRH